MDALPPIFEHLSEGELEFALRYFEEIPVDYGATLIREGEEDPTLVVVLDGQLEARKENVKLGRIDTGGMVGEMAMFRSGAVRSATVESLTPSTLLVLTRENFDVLRRKRHPVVEGIEFYVLDSLIQRLRETNAKISGASRGTPIEHVTPSPGFFDKVSTLFSGPVLYESERVDDYVVLQKSGLFDDFDEETLKRLVPYFREEGCRRGTFICTEGQLADTMYVVADGKVDVICQVGDTRAEILAELEVGDAFGMGALVQEGFPRMASCVAATTATLLVMDREKWREVIEMRDPIANALRTAMIRSLADQLAYANRQLDQINLEKKAASTAEFTPLLRAGAGMEAHGSYMDE